MSKSTLEITISVEATATAVSDIKELFSSDLDLSDAVTAFLDQKLKAAGITDELKISLNRNRLYIKSHSSGGLNAQEWLEAGGFAS